MAHSLSSGRCGPDVPIGSCEGVWGQLEEYGDPPMERCFLCRLVLVFLYSGLGTFWWHVGVVAEGVQQLVDLRSRLPHLFVLRGVAWRQKLTRVWLGSA